MTHSPHLVTANHPDTGLEWGWKLLETFGEKSPSRAGDVIVSSTPVITHWTDPVNRVSLCPIRDANPFFHLYEAMWMLAGESDATMLDKYVHDFSARFAEDDGIQHGAYGARWKQWFTIDQLEACIETLRNNPTSRQVVLSMWDPDSDLMGQWKDRPCNTHAYFRRRGNILDLTVCCRSNDIYWGCYGANAVHFSILLEYVAARSGCEIGSYYQFSNNYHIYENMVEKAKKVKRPYGMSKPSRLFMPGTNYEKDIRQLVDTDDLSFETFEFREVIAPMFSAWQTRKSDPEYSLSVLRPEHYDWHQAAYNWIKRRMK